MGRPIMRMGITIMSMATLTTTTCIPPTSTACRRVDLGTRHWRTLGRPRPRLELDGRGNGDRGRAGDRPVGLGPCAVDRAVLVDAADTRSLEREIREAIDDGHARRKADVRRRSTSARGN